MTHHRALFVSDVHVGARASQGARFRAWLERNRADVTYVIGDLFDGAHALRAPDLVETIKVLARAPGRIVYVPGNHDALFRRLAGVYGRLEICARATHTALNGRRLLVLHGDEFDGSLRYGLPTLGSIVDSYARRIFPARRIEAATQAVNRWATGGAKLGERLGAAAREAGCVGIVTGHFHNPGLRTLPCGTEHWDAGDWLSHCTAICESHYGNFELLRG